MDEGYTITHRGVLCWTTIPTAALRFPLRSLFLILETAFDLAFWAMKSRSKPTACLPYYLGPWTTSNMTVAAAILL